MDSTGASSAESLRACLKARGNSPPSLTIHSPHAEGVAALRAVNTKAYLVEEKGIDTGRIEVRTGTEDVQKVILWIVPAGTTLDMSNTVSIDESLMGGA